MQLLNDIGDFFYNFGPVGYLIPTAVTFYIAIRMELIKYALSKEVKSYETRLQRQSLIGQKRLDAYETVMKLILQTTDHTQPSYYDQAPILMAQSTVDALRNLENEVKAWHNANSVILSGTHIGVLVDFYVLCLWSYRFDLEQAIKARDADEVAECLEYIAKLQENTKGVRDNVDRIQSAIKRQMELDGYIDVRSAPAKPSAWRQRLTVYRKWTHRTNHASRVPSTSE